MTAGEIEARTRGRLEGLREAVGRLRARGGRVPLERRLMIAGGAMIVLGIPLIVLGWLGAARTPYLFEQIPYLISGGLLGVALAVLGGLLYFGYWTARQVQETRRQGEETREVLARIEEALHEGASAPVRGKAAAAVVGGSNGTYYVTARGTMFHRKSCAVVAGRKDVRKVGAVAGLVPCKICDPLGE